MRQLASILGLVVAVSFMSSCSQGGGALGGLVEDHKFVSAGQWLKEHPEADPSVVDMLQVARYYRERVSDDNYTRSKQILERILKKDPEYIPARLMLADVLREQTEYNEALKYYNELSEIDSIRFIVLPERARLYTALHEFNKAKADISEAKSIQPRYYASFLADGMLQYARGELEQALDLFEIAEELDPGLSAEASLYAGIVLLNSRINHDARFKFDRAIEIGRNINKGYAFINRGICQLNLTDSIYACQDFDSAMTYMSEQMKEQVERDYIDKYCENFKKPE